MTSPTVESEADGTTFPWTDKTPADLQKDIVISNGKFTGEVYFIEGGISPSGYLSGDGYFLAVKFTDIDEAATSVKVGLTPSAGSGLVEIIDDPDKNGVFKITNKNQKFTVVSSNDETSTTDYYDLSTLTYTTKTEDEGV